VEGIDLTVADSRAVEPGRLSARLAYTHLLDGFEIPLPGAEKNEFVGEIGTSDDRAVLGLAYKWRNFVANWTTNYISGASLDDQFLAAFDLEPGAQGFGPVT
jgi:hypothetical protein